MFMSRVGPFEIVSVASILGWLAVLVAFRADDVTASIIIPRTDMDGHQYVGKIFESRAASFGKRLQFGKKYEVRLQLHQGHAADPYLCDPPITTSQTLGTYPDLFVAENTIATTTGDDNVIVPRDRLPVAILVKRGNCKFEEKARNALSLVPAGVVKYIIIYDDKRREQLVPMSADHGDRISIDLGLVFVSLETGTELLRYYFEQSAATKAAGGIKLYIDSNSHWRNTFYGDQKDGMIATLSGFLIFIFCCGFSLICVQAGFIHIENGFIFVGNMPPEGWTPNGGNDDLLNGRLMTTEEANSLPSVSYERLKDGDDAQLKTDENDEVDTETEDIHDLNNHCCAVCLEDYLPGENILILPCKHSFHTSCIVPWLTERSSTCPLCKMNLLQHARDANVSMEETEVPATGDTDDEEEDQEQSNDRRESSSDSHWWPRFFSRSTNMAAELNEPLLYDEDEDEEAQSRATF